MFISYKTMDRSLKSKLQRIKDGENLKIFFTFLGIKFAMVSEVVRKTEASGQYPAGIGLKFKTSPFVLHFSKLLI